MKIAIVAPAYNEQDRLPLWIQEVDTFFLENKGEYTSVDLIIIDDGSSDNTYEICKKTSLNTRSINVHVHRLLKNFGHQAAITCGLIEATKLETNVDAVVTMDSDGEHPISLIPKLTREWKKGHPLIHTLRKQTLELSFFKRIFSKIFYILIQRITSLPIDQGMADFKLWDKDFLMTVLPNLPRAGALRLFAVYLYPRGPRIEFDQIVLRGRVSRFSVKKMVSLAMQSIVFYSSLPMRVIGIVGIISIALSLGLTIHALSAYIDGKAVPGWASVIVTISFFCGCNSICLYIVAEYLLRVSFRPQLPQFVKMKN